MAYNETVFILFDSLLKVSLTYCFESWWYQFKVSFK